MIGRLASNFFKNNIVNLAVAGLLGFLSWLVYDKFKDYEKQQLLLLETQQSLEQTNREQLAMIEQITEQNRLTLEHVATVERNTRTISVLRSDLRQLRETVTPDIDPSLYQNEINNLLEKQYKCFEIVTAGGTDASCE
jgi:hypothetical protein